MLSGELQDELPRINRALQEQPYRYMYSLGARVYVLCAVCVLCVCARAHVRVRARYVLAVPPAVLLPGFHSDILCSRGFMRLWPE